MRKSIIYSILLGGAIVLGALPFSSYDVGKLHPVQTLAAAEEGGTVYLAADTGDFGVGENWEAAIGDMGKASQGTIFQGTITHILLDDRALLPEILADDTLSPNCVVCLGEGLTDLEAAGEYLSVHRPETTLVRLRAEWLPLPVLRENEGRLELHGGENG